MIIKGKHSDYTYRGGPAIYVLRDMGHDARGEFIFLDERDRNPLAVLDIVTQIERYYA